MSRKQNNQLNVKAAQQEAESTQSRSGLSSIQSYKSAADVNISDRNSNYNKEGDHVERSGCYQHVRCHGCYVQLTHRDGNETYHNGNYNDFESPSTNDCCFTHQCKIEQSSPDRPRRCRRTCPDWCRHRAPPLLHASPAPSPSRRHYKRPPAISRIQAREAGFRNRDADRRAGKTHAEFVFG